MLFQAPRILLRLSLVYFVFEFPALVGMIASSRIVFLSPSHVSKRRRYCREDDDAEGWEPPGGARVWSSRPSRAVKMTKCVWSCHLTFLVGARWGSHKSKLCFHFIFVTLQHTFSGCLVCITVSARVTYFISLPLSFLHTQLPLANVLPSGSPTNIYPSFLMFTWLCYVVLGHNYLQYKASCCF